MTPPSSSGQRIIALWRRLSPLPGGRWVFARLLGRMVPYTGSIGAQIEALEPGYARVTLRDRRKVRNHLRSIHAVALTNLGEVTSGLAMMAALPPSVRGIPVRIEVDFLKKARGRLVAECRCGAPDVTEPMQHTVTTEIRDPDGDDVAVVRVRWQLGPLS